MIKIFGALALGAVLALSMVGVRAADLSTPAGLWQTIDDKTGLPRSYVRIVETNGAYEGRVEQLLNRQPDEAAEPLCTDCPGERKGKPIIGLTILWGLKKDGDAWTGGEILDPKNGKIYRCKMQLTDGGKKLAVRGFIGISLIGRTQTWLREE